jgi:peptidylprolyl isomerase
MRRHLGATLICTFILTGATACGSGTSPDSGSGAADSTAVPTSIDGVTVTGDFGAKPTVKIDSLDVTGSSSAEPIQGSGPTVKSGDQVLVDLTIVNGTTGEKAYSTFDDGNPLAVTLSKNSFIPSVVDAAVGKSRDSRILVTDTVKNAIGKNGATQIGLGKTDDVVVVMDILSVQPSDVLDSAEGDATTIPSTLPKVLVQGNQVTGVDFSKAAAKAGGKLQVVTLIQGDGPAIQDDTFATVDYYGVVYGAKKAFDESYTSTPVSLPIGVGGVIEGWDEGLVGVRAGSRVMLVVPPAKGYGNTKQGDIPKNSTLVFVIDILGVDH